MSDLLPGLTVNRWRRYGKDRLYVAAADEVRVGFWDLLADEGHPEAPEQASMLVAAVEGWKAAHAATSPGASAPLSPVSPPGQVAVQTDAPETGSGSAPNAPEGPSVPETALPAVDPVVAVAPPSRPVEPTITEPETTTTSAEVTPAARPWIDLATNRAGAEARKQARVAREAAPVKTFLARALGVHTDERAWRIGADGEEKVAAQLARAAKKNPRWRFLHAVPVGDRGSDIDHLIIGPGGIFTVNAKHHPGAKIWVGGSTFMVNGTRQPYIRYSRHEATRAAKLLTAATGFPVHVEGLIVTVNAEDLVVKKAPEGVSVAPRMQVARWLLRHGDILADDVLDVIFEAARRSTTWRP